MHHCYFLFETILEFQNWQQLENCHPGADQNPNYRIFRCRTLLCGSTGFNLKRIASLDVPLGKPTVTKTDEFSEKF